tara:strand:+ start:1239 stop:1430 length:192 start_codon:yes stop_codon:yes gene_type:complete
VAKGSSGRLVIEIDPSIKKELYERLGEKGLNMREWFLINANAYLKKNKQSSLLIDTAHQKVDS